MRYKFRAECLLDVQALPLGDITIRETDTSDVECEIETELSLEELRDAMREVMDGHVMVQTVALAEHYTGERDYEVS